MVVADGRLVVAESSNGLLLAASRKSSPKGSKPRDIMTKALGLSSH